MAKLIPAPSPLRAKVLVVDDEPGLLRGTSRLLTQAGHDVATAGDGVTAANLMASGEFDVVLSDISMPDMTGLELLAIARDLELDVPIIMITGAPTVKTAVEALRYGAVEYLMKPLELPVLERAIERAVKARAAARTKREPMTPLGPGDGAALESKREGRPEPTS